MQLRSCVRVLLPSETQKEASAILQNLTRDAENISIAEKAFYNLGNIAFNSQDYAKSIELYKNALRKNPDNDKARENLRLAQKGLKTSKIRIRTKTKIKTSRIKTKKIRTNRIKIRTRTRIMTKIKTIKRPTATAARPKTGSAAEATTAGRHKPTKRRKNTQGYGK